MLEDHLLGELQSNIGPYWRSCISHQQLLGSLPVRLVLRKIIKTLIHISCLHLPGLILTMFITR